jgi:hypothetical protein
MSFISNIRKLYRNLLDALRLAHIACRAAARINTELQNSNASPEIKAQGAAFLTSANALCEAIQDYKDSLG